MRKPDFNNLNKLTKTMSDIDNAFASMYADKQIQENNIKHLCARKTAGDARKKLAGISTDELKKAKVGIRVSALMDAGYNNLGDVAMATDADLLKVDGIGEKQLEAIHNIVTEFANSLAARASVRLEESDAELITELFRYMKSEHTRIAAREDSANFRNFYMKISSEKIIRNGVHWFFSGSAKKQATLAVVDALSNFYYSPFFEKLVRHLDSYEEAIRITQHVALPEFRKSSADFYALLENLGADSGNRPFLYDSIPMGLASEVQDVELNLSGFTGNLRAYQNFGVKYIIHQQKVLLGDEMGLGKTIQAIAAMTHIAAIEEKPHFLIICPASVIINWAREIKKFTGELSNTGKLKTYILHGSGLDDSFLGWRNDGGVAITNYESMGKIVDGIDNHMHLSMLVVDEAHYMKNPDAKRTMYIRRLDNESGRILMMTGTPLENRVEEMCNLIDFVRPDMTEEVKSLAHISSLPEFKEKLSPVYLRRTRQQVLTELPPIEEREEWCAMSDEDKSSYVAAIMGGNFADMRRVSFLQTDMKTSSKAVRLLELCEEARDEGRKVVIYSFFRDTVAKVSSLFGERCAGVISGETKMEDRQAIVDAFSESEDGSVLVCQIQAGGVGLNIQAASIVIFCEPQIKPSLTNQALSRVYRMGQVKNVLVYHLLCPDTVDEKMMAILAEKTAEFDNFAADSSIAGAAENIMDNDWIKQVIEEENKKYLPAVVM